MWLLDVQVWNPRTGVCTATVDTGYGLSLLWAPGNRHAVVGTKASPAFSTSLTSAIVSAHWAGLRAFLGFRHFAPDIHWPSKSAAAA